MRRTILATAALLFVLTSSWAQQDSTSSPNPQQSQVIIRSADSTKDDLAVPLCPSKFDDGPETMKLSNADQSIKPPKLLRSVTAKFSGEARHKKKPFRKFEGDVQISFIVDNQGKPQNLCLEKSFGYGLDANAAIAIQQYEFAPATKDGKPVPVRVTVDINYRLY